ncbi:MAG: AMP nucleosidase [Pseudomonadota bacterium]
MTLNKTDSPPVNPPTSVDFLLPPIQAGELFIDPEKAVERLQEIYSAQTSFLRSHFDQLMKNGDLPGRARAFYPSLSFSTESFAQTDSRLAFGHVAQPGEYTTTITRPDLFDSYLREQIRLLVTNHGLPIRVGVSETPIPLHFAFGEGSHVDGAAAQKLTKPLRDYFDVPDLTVTNDDIVNGDFESDDGEPLPLSPFPAQRIDYSLHRLAHYTATGPDHFQNFVLFTNYQFYIDEFCAFAHETIKNDDSGYLRFVEPGGVMTERGKDAAATGHPPPRLPQMPAYHLVGKDHKGITMVNIGVGPSNAKTITDHIAVLRPHAWLMLGHCAGLRNSQALGDYVLAHAYVREDHVLDDDLPLSVPVPALAEVQVALEQAVAEVTGFSGYELKRIMRTGTVATIDNRNWELRDQRGPVKRLSQSRAIALDMESATIAANGFRFRVPYGTLLCVSDKPLHGELKLPGMATDFYRTQVNQHLAIGIMAMEKLAQMAPERLHSRKLRSFFETAFQ